MIGVRVDLPRSLAVTLQSDHTDERIRAAHLFFSSNEIEIFFSLSLSLSFLLFVRHYTYTHYRLLPFFFFRGGGVGPGGKLGLRVDVGASLARL